MDSVETDILGATLKIINSAQSIRSAIVRELYPQINRLLRSRATKIVSEIQSELRARIFLSDTYISLTSGGAGDTPLRGHFGFPVGEEKSIVDPIVNTFVGSLKYDMKDFTENGGHFRIIGVPASYNDVLGLDSASIINTGRAGGQITWLSWLLRAGSTPQISDYHIQFTDLALNTTAKGQFSLNASRSKIALMYKRGSWEVPIQFAGTENSNWITRILDDQSFITAVLTIFERNLVT